MACYGLVTRLEQRGLSTIKVGVEFRKLEMPHRIMLAQALAKKLREQMIQEKNEVQWTLRKLLQDKRKPLLLAGLALIVWGIAFYVLSTIFVST